MLIEAKDDGDGGDNWTTRAISLAKLQSNHHHQQTNIQFFYRPDALPVTNQQCQSTEGHSRWNTYNNVTVGSCWLSSVEPGK